MEIIRMFKDSVSEEAAHLLQVYKNANEKVAGSNDLDDKISAYESVVNFCMSSAQCKYDDSIKRNKVLYWAYHNMADSLVNKNVKLYDEVNFNKALQYYNSALVLSKDDLEKAKSLSKIAEVYKLMNDKSSWYDVRLGLIEYIPEESKREAYVLLANDWGGDVEVYELLEEALQYVSAENVSAKVKCQNTIDICKRLLFVYENKKDGANHKRIKDLYDKASELIAKTI